jgi:hypothetical protein
MVMVFPVVVAEIQVADGVPAIISGLEVEPVLSLPTTVMVLFAGTVPLEDENVADAGLPSNTAVFDGVTRRLTDTVVSPLGVVMVIWAVYVAGLRLLTPLKRSTIRVAGPLPKVPEPFVGESKFSHPEALL